MKIRLTGSSYTHEITRPYNYYVQYEITLNRQHSVCKSAAPYLQKLPTNHLQKSFSTEYYTCNFTLQHGWNH